MTLWGCAFEDFLTRTVEPDDVNLVDAYLKRRGWKEPVANRRYMEALCRSVMSLYEVSGLVPGESFLARDLVRGAEPVRVMERTASRSLAPWERIVARIVEHGCSHVMAGGVFSFGRDASEEVLCILKSSAKRAGRVFEKLAEEGGSAGRCRPERPGHNPPDRRGAGLSQTRMGTCSRVIWWAAESRRPWSLPSGKTSGGRP